MRPLVVDAIDVVDLVQHRVELGLLDGGCMCREGAARGPGWRQGSRRGRAGHGEGQWQRLRVVPASRHEREVPVGRHKLLQPRQDLVVRGRLLDGQQLADGRPQADQLPGPGNVLVRSGTCRGDQRGWHCLSTDL